ncbi:MAG TPA: cyanate hydratase, partial [Pararobbsia sp.]|nr:cyanate hydratase [Pararobbsia sp.]
MMQTQFTQGPRQDVTDIIIDAKRRKNLTFEQLSEGTGLSLEYVTAALLGQHPLPAQAARQVGEKLGLDDDAFSLLQTIP